MIGITRNPDSDTRTASRYVTFDKFQRANRLHREEVKSVIQELGDKLIDIGVEHDYTKLQYEEEYFRDFKDTLENGSDFTKGEWYQMHIHKEKHHPTAYCHDDINLLHIIEFISDVLVATAARKGEAEMVELPPEILQKAYENTITLIKGMIFV